MYLFIQETTDGKEKVNLKDHKMTATEKYKS